MTKITLTPDTPTAGQPVTICYEDGPLPVTLSTLWTPVGLLPTGVTCTADAKCQTITVPGTATSVIVHDPNGKAEDVASVIAPP